ncbi:MAG: DnaJ domain-containing protein [Candidatus Latescibacteria bacterium]|nr:DnaJ domain-containing protein [Candidatus Latescibacterota bacterium]
MEFKDYYKILGVSKKSSQDEIQKAYRKLAKKYHPDKNQDTDSDARFKEIGEAYDVLKEPDKRSKYDRYGAAWKASNTGHHGSPGFGGGGFDFGHKGSGQNENFYDVLEHLFGNGAMGNGFGGSGQRTHQAKGQDVEARLPLSLEEVSRGGKQTVSLRDSKTGKLSSYTVSIPEGVSAGKRIRLAGQGQAGFGSGEPGDLYLIVDLLKHPQFDVKGQDLYTTLDIQPHQAVLGAKVPLDTLGGQIRVNIPAATKSGQKIRIGGQGLGEMGHLFAEVRIVVPDILTPRQRELYEELAEIENTPD